MAHVMDHVLITYQHILLEPRGALHHQSAHHGECHDIDIMAYSMR